MNGTISTDDEGVVVVGVVDDEDESVFVRVCVGVESLLDADGDDRGVGMLLAERSTTEGLDVDDGSFVLEEEEEEEDDDDDDDDDDNAAFWRVSSA